MLHEQKQQENLCVISPLKPLLFSKRPHDQNVVFILSGWKAGFYRQQHVWKATYPFALLSPGVNIPEGRSRMWGAEEQTSSRSQWKKEDALCDPLKLHQLPSAPHSFQWHADQPVLSCVPRRRAQSTPNYFSVSLMKVCSWWITEN